MNKAKNNDLATAWRQLLAGLVLNAVVGSIFAFGKLSSSLERQTGASTSQVALVGLAGDLGLWLNVVPGAAQNRVGARGGLIVGLALGAFGYAAVALLLARHAHYGLVAAAWFVCGHANSWLYVTGLVTNVKNWHPSARGSVVGCLQAFFGASGALFVQFFVAFFRAEHVVAYVGTVGAVTLLAGVWMLANVEPVPFQRLDRVGERRCARIATLVAGLLCLIIATSLSDATSWGAYGSIVSLALMYPLVLYDTPEDFAGEEVLLPADNSTPLAPLAALSEDTRRDFWLLWLGFGAAVGGAIATSNSMSAIAQATSSCRFDVLASRAVTLLTSFDAGARMVAGVYVQRRGNGGIVLACACAFLATAHVGFLALPVRVGSAFSPPAWRVLGCASFVGAANGAAWTACPWLVSNRFGTERYGDNFGLACTGAMVAVVIFSYVILPIDDTASSSPRDCQLDDDDDDPSDVCYGAHCFRTFHHALIVAGAIGMLVSLRLDLKRSVPPALGETPGP
ncbi:hypothetical protein CTAYLR_003409 [Chrysophaeum taylorii]|uniref:Nodulin-like domain-containing protein n=1 Tax=Chrysophaeum taylorii TaxID=2483200 RepID=A0AAD7U7Q4_9STRA|nr:hypothetical protein CTAYLR_003409 [Chrysophaeum taylorii]